MPISFFFFQVVEGVEGVGGAIEGVEDMREGEKSKEAGGTSKNRAMEETGTREGEDMEGEGAEEGTTTSKMGDIKEGTKGATMMVEIEVSSVLHLQKSDKSQWFFKT